VNARRHLARSRCRRFDGNDFRGNALNSDELPSSDGESAARCQKRGPASCYPTSAGALPLRGWVTRTGRVRLNKLPAALIGWPVISGERI
jgi:hypothetical protein